MLQLAKLLAKLLAELLASQCTNFVKTWHLVVRFAYSHACMWCLPVLFKINLNMLSSAVTLDRVSRILY